MSPIQAAAILLRANTAISYAAMGDKDKTAESWMKLVALVARIGAADE